MLDLVGNTRGHKKTKSILVCPQLEEKITNESIRFYYSSRRDSVI